MHVRTPRAPLAALLLLACLGAARGAGPLVGTYRISTIDACGNRLYLASSPCSVKDPAGTMLIASEEGRGVQHHFEFIRKASSGDSLFGTPYQIKSLGRAACGSPAVYLSAPEGCTGSLELASQGELRMAIVEGLWGIIEAPSTQRGLRIYQRVRQANSCKREFIGFARMPCEGFKRLEMMGVATAGQGMTWEFERVGQAPDPDERCVLPNQPCTSNSQCCSHLASMCVRNTCQYCKPAGTPCNKSPLTGDETACADQICEDRPSSRRQGVVCGLVGAWCESDLDCCGQVKCDLVMGACGRSRQA